MFNLLHGISAVIALLTGTYITVSVKGNGVHKKVGYIYVASMLFTIISSFWIYDLFGSFGVFHVMSIISLVTLILGMSFPLFFRKQKFWVVQHYFWMIYSFVGLVLALGSHLSNFFPKSWPFYSIVLIVYVIPYSIGSYFAFSYKNQMMKDFGLD